MKVRDRIMTAARTLAGEKPAKDISLAELARASGVSWPTVRRHVGGRDGLPRFLEAIGAASADTAGPQGVGAEAADTRSRILEAAFRTFARHGYSGATLDDVAADAGLTKGAVYWHFAGKDDLCMALIEERFRREAARIPDDIRDAVRDGAGERALVAFVAHEVQQARKGESWRRLGLEFVSRSRNPALRHRYAELARKFYDDTLPVAQWLIDSGVVAKDLDPQALAVVWRCILLGVGLWMTQDPDGLDFDAMAPRLAQVMWRGMAPGDADAEDRPMAEEAASERTEAPE
ncbi:MAG: TetR family transcriptional regulator [Rhodospirillales bacterium]|nr:TetR family transcriptional regulator [Rhodospirillales bacterium]MDH3918472.1 TetR family transcriptional regulator [Rhodospirillales bacterium]MDH3965741.1 TetR family transcriptional regulator [Rhodospirillales bacterium]